MHRAGRVPAAKRAVFRAEALSQKGEWKIFEEKSAKRASKAPLLKAFKAPFNTFEESETAETGGGGRGRFVKLVDLFKRV